MIYGAGIWSVAIIVGLAFGYARVFDAARWVYWLIVGLALLVVAGSQLLPDEHPFYQSMREDLTVLFWLGVIAIPVGAYSALVRLAHQKARQRDDA